MPKDPDRISVDEACGRLRAVGYRVVRAGQQVDAHYPMAEMAYRLGIGSDGKMSARQVKEIQLKRRA